MLTQKLEGVQSILGDDSISSKIIIIITIQLVTKQHTRGNQVYNPAVSSVRQVLQNNGVDVFLLVQSRSSICYTYGPIFAALGWTEKPPSQ